MLSVYGSTMMQHVNPVSKGLFADWTGGLRLLGVLESNVSKNTGFVTRLRLTNGTIKLFGAIDGQAGIDVSVEIVVICNYGSNMTLRMQLLVAR